VEGQSLNLSGSVTLEKSELRTSHAEAMFGWLSIENRVPRNARLKGPTGSPSRLLSALGLVPIFRRAGSAHSAEYTGEVLLAFEAAGHGNIQHAHFSRTQHLLGSLGSAT